LSLAWHALFAPLPQDVVVQRKPVPAMAGWHTLSAELSAGPAGLRHVMVTLDAAGTPNSAADWVMFRTQTAEGVTYVHENVGGRLEPNGHFSGTRWRTVIFERTDGDEPESRETSQLPPSPQDIEAIQALVLDVLRLSRRD
jgi:hypothetical protein